MKPDTIIEYGDNETYYLSAKTEQNGQVYFLATKLNENQVLTAETKIFVEEHEDGNIYFEPLEEGKVYEMIAAIFMNEAIKNIEEMPE